MIRVYGMAYSEVMGLPMSVFWQLSGSVNRIHADEHKQLLEVQMHSQSPELAQQLHEALHKQSPDPIKFTAKAIVASATFDRGGLDALRSMQ